MHAIALRLPQITHGDEPKREPIVVAIRSAGGIVELCEGNGWAGRPLLARISTDYLPALAHQLRDLAVDRVKEAEREGKQIPNALLGLAKGRIA